MGAIVVKGFKYYTQREQLMLQCIDDLKDNPEGQEILMKTCDRAYKYLSRRISPDAQRANQKVFGDNGGVDLVLGILVNIKSEIVLRAACRLLSELAADEMNAERLRVANAIEMVDKVLKENDDDSFIKSDVKKMKDRMVTSGTRLEQHNIQKAAEEEKILPLLQAMHNQPQNKKILQTALHTLWDLAGDPKVREQCYDDDLPIYYMLDTIKTHIRDKKIQKLGIKTISELVKDEVVRGKLGHMGAMESVIRTIRAHIREFELVQFGVWIIKQYAMVEKSRLTLIQNKCGLVIRRAIRIAQENELGTYKIPLRVRRLIKVSIEKGETETDECWDDEVITMKQKLEMEKKAKEKLENEANEEDCKDDS